jgi:hypothetical protein
MLFYNAVLYILVFMNLAAYGSPRLIRPLYFVGFAALWFMASFRWQVGCDFGSYMHQFEGKLSSADISNPSSYKEPGYVFLIYILHLLNMPWYYLNVACAISVFAGIHVLSRREPNRLLFLSLLYPMYVVGLSMSAVRQGLAAGFVCFAFNAFSDKKLLRYFLFVGIAATFHNSAIAFLALSPFLFPGNGKLKLAIGLAAALPALYMMARSETAQTYASMYIATGVEAEGGRYRAIPGVISALLFLFFIRQKWRYIYSDDYQIALICSILLLSIPGLLLVSSVMGDRFGYYLMIISFSIQARAHKLVPPAYSFALFIFPLLLAMVYMLGWTMMSWQFSYCYVPYRTWWSGM